MPLQNKKNLGQHWLHDRAILDEIATLAEPNAPESPSELVLSPLCLEVGPGLGTLTARLLRHFKGVLAVEYDEKLAKNLPNSFPGTSLEVVHQDFLKFDLSEIKEPYVVAGNIPYYITSPIITKLLEAENPPLKIVLLIQKEVADRIAAKQGDHTYLSIFVQNRAKVTKGPFVSRRLFTPPPKVDSAVIVLEPKKPYLTEAELKLVKLGFSSPRKKLVKNLPYPKEQVEPFLPNKDARPADLSLKDWKTLAKNLKIS